MSKYQQSSCPLSDFLIRNLDKSRTFHRELILPVNDDSLHIRCTHLTYYLGSLDIEQHHSHHRYGWLYYSCRTDIVLMRYLLSSEYLRYSNSIEKLSKNNLCIIRGISRFIRFLGRKNVQAISVISNLKSCCLIQRRFSWKTSLPQLLKLL